jgi:hypothetical protein
MKGKPTPLVIAEMLSLVIKHQSSQYNPLLKKIKILFIINIIINIFSELFIINFIN